MSLYSLLAGIALYALIAQHSSRIRSAALAAAIVVGGNLILRIAEYAIVYGIGNAFAMFTEIDQLTITAVQYVTAVFIFRKIQDSGDSDLPAYLGWVATGWLIIFIAIPFVIGKIF